MWRSVAKYFLNNRIYQSGMPKLLPTQNALCHPVQDVLHQGSRLHSRSTLKLNVPVSAIQKVESFHEQRWCIVHWEDGNQSLYPYAWLRDNCQCSHCFLTSAKARKLPIKDLDVNIFPEKIILSDSKPPLKKTAEPTSLTKDKGGKIQHPTPTNQFSLATVPACPASDLSVINDPAADVDITPP